jgi:CheY-like chemotaxis protein
LCGTESVLLVEDETGLRSLLVQVLREAGYKVLVAANGPEALEFLEKGEHEIDLLLTDVVMPEMRGQVLAERLRKKYSEMATMFMSGYTDNALIHNGTLPAGTVFLQKPFTPDVMLQRVRQTLDAKRSRNQPMRHAG